MYTKVEHAVAGTGSGTILVLAHGAGAPADSSFMELLAASLSEHGVTSVRFEFPYMDKRRADGRKRPPDREPVLLDCFTSAIDEVTAEYGEGRPLFIGGKSMGGRMASVLAASERLPGTVAGVTCFGYPFHPPGKPERLRTGHFTSLYCPLFIAQGTRDPFGKVEEFSSGVPGGENVRVCWLEGGNHDLKPLARQQLPANALIERAAREASAFMDSVVRHG